jgi:drug/metabolite transporter (DMT)-like permease
VTEEKLKVIVVMLLAVLAVSFGEALLAKGMKQSNEVTGGLWAQARGLLGNVHVVGGTLLMAAYFGLYMLALRWADLSFVLPLTALSYLLGALLAKYYLGEHVTPVRWIGALIITVGVIIVGLGDKGAPHRP